MKFLQISRLKRGERCFRIKFSEKSIGWKAILLWRHAKRDPLNRNIIESLLCNRMGAGRVVKRVESEMLTLSTFMR